MEDRAPNPGGGSSSNPAAGGYAPAQVPNLFVSTSMYGLHAGGFGSLAHSGIPNPPAPYGPGGTPGDPRGTLGGGPFHHHHPSALHRASAGALGLDGGTPGLSTAEARREMQREQALVRAAAGDPSGVVTAAAAHASSAAPPTRAKLRCFHDGCDKAFSWPQDLAKHVRKAHSGEPPKFACAYEGCGQKFFERKLLVAHVRTHTDERPFACEYPGCDKKFRARNALAYHVKAVHESGDAARCPEPGCAFTTRRPQAMAAHKLRHDQRRVVKAREAKAKADLAAAVRRAKDEAKAKAVALAATEKQLAKEKKAHAKTLRALEEVRAKIERHRARGGGSGGGALAAAGGRRKRARANDDSSRGGGGGGASADASATLDDGVLDDDAPEAERRDRDGKRPRTAAGAANEALAALVAALGPARAPEVLVLPEGPGGAMVPMLAMDTPAAAQTAERRRLDAKEATEGGGEARAQDEEASAQDEANPNPNPNPNPDPNPSGSRVVSGRRVLPTCAQALPSDPSFIGCPGIRCGSPGSASDYTVLFHPDGTRDSGNRQTTPLEVLHPKDPARFNARSWACPWASYLAQATLERCADAAALRRLLDECAPRKALKVKPVDGMCAACYAAHVALAARTRARINKRRAAGGGEGGGGANAGGGGGGLAEEDDDAPIAEVSRRIAAGRRGE